MYGYCASCGVDANGVLIKEEIKRLASQSL